MHLKHQHQSSIYSLIMLKKDNFAEAEKMMASNIIFAKEDYQWLMRRYDHEGKLENALNVLKRVRANGASFECKQALVSIVELMIKKDFDFNEIENLLLSHPVKESAYPSIFYHEFEELLGKLAHSGQMELFQKLYDALVKYNIIKAKV